MEGYLQKYINVVYRWKPRYFILKNGILTYSDQKGDLVKGTIYLKISEIILTPEDPLKIIINSGTKTLHLRANSIGDKIKWINALRLSQEEIIKNQEEEMKNSIHHQQNSKYSIESFNSFTPKANKEKNLLNFSDFINKKIHELSHLQINLNDILKEFEKKIEIDNNLMQFFEKIKFTIDEILKKTTQITIIFDDERKKMNKLERKINISLEKIDGVRVNVNDGRSLIMSEEELNKKNLFDDLPSQEREALSFKAKSQQLSENDSDENSNFKKSLKILPIIQEADLKKELCSPDNTKKHFGSFNEKNNNDNNNKLIINMIKSKNDNEVGDDNNGIKSAKTEDNNIIGIIIQKHNENLNNQFKERKKITIQKSFSRNYTDENKTENTFYQSFDYSPPKNNEEIEKNNLFFNTENILKQVKNIEDISESSEQQEEASPDILLPGVSPVIKRILTKNEGFKHFILENKDFRKKLPKLYDPIIETIGFNKLKINLDSLSIPIQLHEPLSLLQNYCEEFENTTFIEKIISEKNSSLRLANIIAFSLSNFSKIFSRLKRPFDPVLGETYEFHCPIRKFDYFAEKVSNNPSTIAFYFKNDYFSCWSNLNLKVSSNGKNIEFRPLGVTHLLIDETQDHFIWSRPITSWENILNSDPFIDHYGDMNFTNLLTHDTAILSFNKNTSPKEINKNVDGYIKNMKGKILFELNGKWDNYLTLKEVESKKEILLFENKSNEQIDKNNFLFNDFTLQLNHLNKKILQNIQSTDSRVRPDIRALEYLEYEIAEQEKNKIENNEKILSKQLNENNDVLNSKWFNCEMDPITKLMIYKFEQKKKNANNILDLY